MPLSGREPRLTATQPSQGAVAALSHSSLERRTPGRRFGDKALAPRRPRAAGSHDRIRAAPSVRDRARKGTSLQSATSNDVEFRLEVVASLRRAC